MRAKADLPYHHTPALLGCGVLLSGPQATVPRIPNLGRVIGCGIGDRDSNYIIVVIAVVVVAIVLQWRCVSVMAIVSTNEN
jgi:hypothetical protein